MDVVFIVYNDLQKKKKKVFILVGIYFVVVVTLSSEDFHMYKINHLKTSKVLGFVFCFSLILIVVEV